MLSMGEQYLILITCNLVQLQDCIAGSGVIAQAAPIVLSVYVSIDYVPCPAEHRSWEWS